MARSASVFPAVFVAILYGCFFLFFFRLLSSRRNHWAHSALKCDACVVCHDRPHPSYFPAGSDTQLSPSLASSRLGVLEEVFADDDERCCLSWTCPPKRGCCVRWWERNGRLFLLPSFVHKTQDDVTRSAENGQRGTCTFSGYWLGQDMGQLELICDGVAE